MDKSIMGLFYGRGQKARPKNSPMMHCQFCYHVLQSPAKIVKSLVCMLLMLRFLLLKSFFYSFRLLAAFLFYCTLLNKSSGISFSDTASFLVQQHRQRETSMFPCFCPTMLKSGR